jgi:hypothetical protein
MNSTNETLQSIYEKIKSKYRASKIRERYRVLLGKRLHRAGKRCGSSSLREPGERFCSFPADLKCVKSKRKKRKKKKDIVILHEDETDEIVDLSTYIA